jgi:hypothetical protein
VPTPPAKPRRLVIDGQKTELPPLIEVARSEFAGGPPDLPAPTPSGGREGRQRGRGRPPKTPNGTWEDVDDLFNAVTDILGDTDDRAERGTEITEALGRVAHEFLGADLLTEKRRKRVQFLARKAVAGKISTDEIVRELLVWRHDLTDPAVREMQKRLRVPVAHEFTTLVLKYESVRPLRDADGKPVRGKDGRRILVQPPVCDEKGRPILWVADEHGHPSRPYVAGEPLQRRPLKTVRPRVKMIFR